MQSMHNPIFNNQTRQMTNPVRKNHQNDAILLKQSFSVDDRAGLSPQSDLPFFSQKAQGISRYTMRNAEGVTQHTCRRHGIPAP